MKIERTKNASRNILFGGILKLLQILLPFLMRTVMIYWMGEQYLGLNSLFASVLQVLNLAELGVGSAMVYSMYEPIDKDDTETICALMRLYRIYYRVIGTVVGVAGLVILPFIPHLITGEVPAGIDVRLLFLLNLAQTVCSYWLFGYKNCILSAYQRTDVTSKVTLATNLFQYALQIVVIIFFGNYYVFILVALATIILTNIGTAIVVNKLYPEYKPKGKLPKEQTKAINRRVRDLFTTKIGTVVVNSADTIVISAFLGLSALAVFQNYFYIITALAGIFTILFEACQAGIGNSLITETKEKNFTDFRKFSFIIGWLSGFCSVCLLCLYQPFMQIWMGGNENLMLGLGEVVCFAVYFYVYENDQLFNTFKDAGGIWHKDRFRPLVTAGINLALNLIFVTVFGWGIYGIILSTVISLLFVGTPWLIVNLFTTLFDKKDAGRFVLRFLFYALVTAVAGAATYFICSLIRLGAWATLLLRALVCLILPNLIFLLAYRCTEEFSMTVALADRVTKGKLRLTRLFPPKEKKK